MPKVLLVAPAAWGKTRYREQLAKHFDCAGVIDDLESWLGCNTRRRPLPDSCLILSDCIPSDPRTLGIRIVRGEEADAALRAVGGEPFNGRRK